MPFQLLREDITRIKVDCIVNPTDSYYSHSRGTDKSIFELAGDNLVEACGKLKPLAVSAAEITSAFNMSNTRYIIHTCGPIYKDNNQDEFDKLYACYINALKLADKNEFKSIAFPLISSGAFGMPKGKALNIATNAITNYLENSELDVYLLVYDKESFDTSKKLFKTVENLIEDEIDNNRSFDCSCDMSMLNTINCEQEASSFKEKVFKEDVPFHIYLQKLIYKKDMKDADIYKRANMDRKLFNNIINGKKKGIIRKETAVSIALGLRLNIKETKELVERSGNSFGYTLFDKIIMAAIKDNEYNIFEINEVLLKYDLVTLGTKTKNN